MSKKVLDKGFIRLDGALADDLSVINAARVSFDIRHEEVEEGDDKLINFLMRNRHGSPFEHNLFRFHIKCPIFVAREWFRHRIGSFNEISGRYVELKEEYYIPEFIREQTGKPGNYTFEEIESEKLRETVKEEIIRSNIKSFETYHQLVQLGVAKELARTVLPVGTYTQFYWSVNARSLMNFLSLRNDKAAQYEIREYATILETEFTTLMPITAKAFIDNGRVAP